MHDATDDRWHRVIDAMLKFWDSRPESNRSQVRFAADPDADRLVKQNLTAFLIAGCLDRTGQALQLWNIPFLLKSRWGHLDPELIQTMNPGDLATDPIVARAPSITSRLHLARTIISVAQVIVAHGGNPNRLLDGSIADILGRLTTVFGVGPNIARMILIQRMLYFGLRPTPGGELLPKLDVHVIRVLERTGVVSTASDSEVRVALRGLSALEVAVVDQVAWIVGREFCFPRDPDCRNCALDAACEKRWLFKA